MADFTDSFWSGYIALLTLLGIVGCGILLWAQSTSKVKVSPDADGMPQTTGHTWDDDLSELNNPLPRWWMWLFYITIVFGVVYLALYPGLGSYSGVLGWSSVQQFDQEQKQAVIQYGPIFDKYLSQDVAAVATDPDARAIGQRLFLANCAQCHGFARFGAFMLQIHAIFMPKIPR